MYLFTWLLRNVYRRLPTLSLLMQDDKHSWRTRSFGLPMIKGGISRRTQIQYKTSVEIGTIHNLSFEVFKQVSVSFVYSVFAERMKFSCIWAWYVVLLRHKRLLKAIVLISKRVFESVILNFDRTNITSKLLESRLQSLHNYSQDSIWRLVLKNVYCFDIL